MKTNILKIRYILIIFIILFVNNKISAQDTIKKIPETLDLKAQLLDTKLQLIEIKLKLLEFTPNQLNQKFNQIDSLFLIHIDSIYNYVYTKTQERISDSISKKTVIDTIPPAKIKIPKTVIKLSLNRIFEGTLQLSYERAIKENFSIDFTASATYVTKNSFGGEYFNKQDFYAFSDVANSYYQYEGEMMRGFGGIIQTRNYLLPRINPKYKAPFGLYASPYLMYRKITISGIYYTDIYQDSIWVTEENEVIQNLDIGSAGVIIGYCFPVLDVLSIDIYVGGVLRLSKYYRESHFTKYKKWNNIDYSGVLPTAGISIGILK
ncbi:MAG: hypothetical protein V1904_03825 [Bacteroidota bacterium]